MKTDKRMINNLKRQIETFQRTGELPRDYDVINTAYSPEDVEDELNALENIPDLTGSLSDDAEALRDNAADFVESLTAQERKVFDLHMVGGLIKKEVALILGVSAARIGQLAVAVATKARLAIEQERIKNGGF